MQDMQGLLRDKLIIALAVFFSVLSLSLIVVIVFGCVHPTDEV